MSIISSVDDLMIDSLRAHLLSNFEDFSKFCFKIQTGSQFLTVDYHSVMFKAIQMLIDQKSNRMIINIPPRAGKTQIITIFLPLFAWCHNPHSQNILTGFNSDVLFECSGYIRSIMIDPDFRRVFPDVEIDMSKKSVERLGTMSSGVTHAVPSAGKITGKGAGAIGKGFSGLMAIDDIIKPEDANSPTERDKINNRFSNTLLSRLATEKTPLVIIMQRLHMNDLCGYLMTGGTADHYDYLNIPGIITKETGSKEWYAKDIEELGYTHCKPLLYDLGRTKFDEDGESSFWPLRKNITTLKGMREKDPYTFYTQYMGKPVYKGSVAVTSDMICYYEDIDLSTIAYTFLTADTASTAETYSDYTISCFWGVNKKAQLVLLDILLGKFEIPELVVEVREFWRKHNKFNINLPNMTPKGFYIEDKSSGQFLNQQYLRDGTVTVRPVPRDGVNVNKKFTRFMNTIPYFRQSRIIFPRRHEHISHCVKEVTSQSSHGSNTGNDDFIDNVSDAVSVAFDTLQMDYTLWA